MIMLFGTNIFWITILGVALISFIATTLGRSCASLFPYRLKPAAVFYLSPMLGLALLTIIASLLGRFTPLGNTVFLPLALIIALIIAISREKNPNQLVSHTLMVTAFTFLCGSGLLLTLFLYGGFNSHNDAFTYLVHGNWLQTHAFNEQISVNTVTPLTTQVSLYQTMGLRMGASFLLALVQALLQLQWSYEVYSTVVIVSMASCCWAIGFPLLAQLKSLPRMLQVLLLSLPSFSLGGLVFGANFGFLPQTLGLSLGAALLFTLGPLFQRLSTIHQPRILFQTAFPCALLFSAVTYSYSEFLPFLLFGILVSSLILAWRHHAWKNFILFGGMFILFSLGLLNNELIRTYSALILQSQAVVGTPVDWTLIGFIAHAFGVHGGAWDIYQWTHPSAIGGYAIAGYCIMLLVLFCLAKSVKQLKHAILNGALLPTAFVLLTLGIGFIYFRYFVLAPFPVGKGQSWSEFKLSDWAHPFIMTFLLFTFACWYQRSKKVFYAVISILLVTSITSSLWMSTLRIQPLLASYKDVNNLEQFYLDFRIEVLATCTPKTPIYLAIQDNDKIRQMIAYFLMDQKLKSDWHNDGYIASWLPQKLQIQSVKANQCVIETIGNKQLLDKSNILGPLQVGMLSNKGKVQIVGVSGTYDKEGDDNNWWYWVENTAHFKLAPLFIPKETKQTLIQFEYATRDPQELTVKILGKKGAFQNIVLRSNGNELIKFNQVINFSPDKLSEIIIETNGKAQALGSNDERKAAWIIRNLSLTPINTRKN